MPAHLNFYDNVDFGAYGRGAQCFDGYGSQDRIDIASVPGAFPAAQATVTGTTRYMTIETDVKVKVYAGPAAATDAVKQARALVTSGFLACSVDDGHAVHVWTA